MPEVVEITLTSQYLSSILIGKSITGMKVNSGRYTHQKMKGSALINKNIPLKILSIDSKGKFMWFELQSVNDPSKRIYIMNTFGLTGMWSLKMNTPRITFNIADGNKSFDLYFTDHRNFGTIAITSKYSDVKSKLDKLAPDLLKTIFNEKTFQLWVDRFIEKSELRSNLPIIKILMEQENNKGIGSGLGNYLSVEILYRAKISPHRTLISLSNQEIKKLANTMRYVLKLCYMSNKTGYMETFIDYIDEHKKNVLKKMLPDYHSDIKIKENETFEFLVYKKKKDKNNNEVKADKIIKGRTTYWVPNVQK
jgi:formamidopyrimidine-DNA glycosylase